MNLNVGAKMTVKTKEQVYFGYRQGWKVYLNGTKWPKQRGYWYTNMKEQEAIDTAIKEMQWEVIQCREDHNGPIH